MDSFDQVMSETLAMVNVVRKAMGAEPLTELPSAAPGRASDCIFARALRPIGVTSVDGDGRMRFSDARTAVTAASYWGVDSIDGTVNAPSQFKEVIDRFDQRQIPFVNANQDG